ncbi:MAG: GDP-L-fucose synthase [Dehalobacter sp.]|nr:GDP-L-fucose synthase [Dehalobacter sp.]
MKKESRIYIAGHTGLIGHAVTQHLKVLGYENLILINHQDLDLLSQQATDDFFKLMRPDYVFMCAGHVGGIQANQRYMADFAMENAYITMNTISSAHKYKVKKFLYLGSSCIYPRECPQPITEKALLTGIPEPTNEGFALAKLLGVRQCVYFQQQYGECFISCIPANTYGPRDHFDPENGHVISALFQRFYEAVKTNTEAITIWGSGNVRREFIYIDDVAKALVFMMRHSELPVINIGTGEDISIHELALIIKDLTGFKGKLIFDTSKPDGMPRRILDSSKAKGLGWKAEMSLKRGLEETFSWFLKYKAK